MERAPDFCFVCLVGGASVYYNRGYRGKGHLWRELWTFDSVLDIFFKMS